MMIVNLRKDSTLARMLFVRVDSYKTGRMISVSLEKDR
jgi:hypothetical protein